MLNSKQKKCIEMMALGDRTQKEIAERLKVTEATICNWKMEEERRLSDGVHRIYAAEFERRGGKSF